MIIRGKERHFSFTVGASIEVSKLCPNGDLNKLNTFFKACPYVKKMELLAKMAVIMNKEYEDTQVENDPKYVPDYLTESDVYHLPTTSMEEFTIEIMSSMGADMKQTVKVAQPKGNSKKKVKKSSSTKAGTSSTEEE